MNEHGNKRSLSGSSSCSTGFFESESESRDAGYDDECSVVAFSTHTSSSSSSLHHDRENDYDTHDVVHNLFKRRHRLKQHGPVIPFTHGVSTMDMEGDLKGTKTNGLLSTYIFPFIMPSAAIIKHQNATIHRTHLPFWAFDVKAHVSYSAETSNDEEPDNESFTASATWTPAPPQAPHETSGERHFAFDDPVCQVYADYQLRADVAAAAKVAELPSLPSESTTEHGQQFSVSQSLAYQMLITDLRERERTRAARLFRSQHKHVRNVLVRMHIADVKARRLLLPAYVLRYTYGHEMDNNGNWHPERHTAVIGGSSDEPRIAIPQHCCPTRARVAAASAALLSVAALGTLQGASISQFAAEAFFASAASMAVASTFSVNYHRNCILEATRARYRREDDAHAAWEAAQLGYAQKLNDDDDMAQFLHRGSPPTYAELFGDSDAAADGASSATDASDASMLRMFGYATHLPLLEAVEWERWMNNDDGKGDTATARRNTAESLGARQRRRREEIFEHVVARFFDAQERSNQQRRAEQRGEYSDDEFFRERVRGFHKAGGGTSGTSGSSSSSSSSRRKRLSASRDILGYYKLLGVPRDASTDEIKIAYRRQAMACHPDTAESEDVAKSTASFRQVSHAYTVLREEESRRRYDAGVPL